MYKVSDDGRFGPPAVPIVAACSLCIIVYVLIYNMSWHPIETYEFYRLINHVALPKLNLSRDYFGTEIIQKCTKRFQIRVHRLKLDRSSQKFNARLF